MKCDGKTAWKDAGVIAFPSQIGTAFRYKLTDSRIWLENRKTKHQWDCAIATVDDYAVNDIKIPGHVVMEYLAYALSKSGDWNGSPGRVRVDLVDAGEARKLCLSLDLVFVAAEVSWRANYAFVLSAIDVSEMDILTSHIRDVQDEVESLRRELKVEKEQFSPLMQLLINTMLKQVGSLGTQWVKQVACTVACACKTGWEKLSGQRPMVYRY